MILTIGHSNRTAEEFIALLLAHGVKRIVDVRTVPRSRHNPQFNRDTLPETLAEKGIRYIHMRGLGGLRRPKADSPNMGWRNDSFRGFADYMQSEDFAKSLGELIDLGKRERIAVMCAEAVPWRCHRSLIADALLARGVSVAHMTGKSDPVLHVLTLFAVVEGGKIIYPANGQTEGEQP